METEPMNPPRPRTLLVKNAKVLATMDASRREIPGGGLFIRDGRIEQVGPTAELTAPADEVLDLDGHVLLPGLVNTHSHAPMVLFRGQGEGLPLDRWLREVMWPREARLTPEDV